MDFDAFKALGLALPLVEESTSYGTPALKVKGKLMARLKEDGESVAVRIPWEERERLLMVAPETYYITDHYRDHPWVLVRLPQAHPDGAKLRLAQAWLLAAPKSLLKLHGARIEALEPDALAALRNETPQPTAEQKVELDRLLAEHDANPNSGLTWDEVEAAAIARMRR
ncbi:MmcQ/YjbR family DNA-binding protein [Duganella sp. S19_KUP01_CR8]|uniref:MmcQ/YjbR family DNA-binding protein n=1 Tax=Duganella sp. S19_KUP01_CR8 TaxID=3025502 RepID=UPI002FCD8078